MAPLTTPATLTSAITTAADAATAGDGDRFAAAVAALAVLDAEQVRVVLGWVLRRALEDLHPDGLDADDLRELVGRVARSSLPWFDGTDPPVFLVALTGAFGEHPDDDDQPRLAHEVVVAHSVLLAVDLAAASDRPLTRHLASALEEVRRTETMEMP